MSKSKRLREMQEEINRLTNELEQANKEIKKYQERDSGKLLDFIKKEE